MIEFPFCRRIAAAKIIIGNGLAVAMHDGYPVSPGHTLFEPRRHITDFLAMNQEEQAAVWALMDPARQNIEKTTCPMVITSA
jgi:diadenosine tetraphosphate (Ap4A) HIT family hydrolase